MKNGDRQDKKGNAMKGNGSRRDFLKTAGFAGVAACASRPVSGVFFPRLPGKKPNIIYLFSDEPRYQSMSFSEMPELKTPHMAEMAVRGTSFKYAISNNPVCVPHRCMLLSGQWPHRTGAVENQGGLSSADRTLGHVFRVAGYVTGYTGKLHAGGAILHAGFDWHMNWGNTNDHWNSHWTDLHGSGQRHDCTIYNATAMTDQALEFIRAGHRPLPADFTERLEDDYIAGHLEGALRAMALTGQISLSTAYANDAAPDLVFAQMENHYFTERTE